MTLIGLTGLFVLLAVLLPPVAQPQAYHLFADVRLLLGIVNFWNVISNVAFLVVGVAGVLAMSGKRVRGGFIERRERWPYLVFFAAIAATAFGSGYYHVAPDDTRLVWDRLPIALACAAFSVAMIADHWGSRAVRALLPALGIGALSVGWWWYTQGTPGENLVPYFTVQVYAMALTFYVLLFRTARYTRQRDLWGVLAIWVLARVAEWLDAVLFAGGSFLSGHTLKHVLAALAAAWLLRMILLREAAAPAPAHIAAAHTAT